MKLIFATHNQNKLSEISSILGDDYQLKGLEELGLIEEIPEDHATIEENASQKSWFVYSHYGRNCFADDSGLEVDALNGAPGVFSARYSRMGDLTFPEMETAAGNIRKLLLEMQGESNRGARFRTVISLVLNGVEHQFEGVIRGEITTKASGANGFGYDPVFKPAGYTETFAEMDLRMKNKISHRALAVQKLAEFLRRM